jgi:hypothetical protein
MGIALDSLLGMGVEEAPALSRPRRQDLTSVFLPATGVTAGYSL